MIQFIRPTIPPVSDWAKYLDASYKEGRFSNFGPVHNLFEQKLTEKYCQPGREAVLVSSATTGLTAALLGFGIKGKVVIPSFTYAATAQAVLQADCLPVFCDIDANTWEISEVSLSEILQRENISAIMPVRSFGFARNFSWLEQIGRERQIPIILDSAAALGGRLSTDIPVGNQGDAEIFSLHITKVFGVGEGGVIFSPPEIAKRIRKVIAFGLSENDILYRGFNGKMSELVAAVGMAILQKIDEYIKNRQVYAAIYKAKLEPLEKRGYIKLPHEPGNFPYQCFPLIVDRKRNSRDSNVEFLIKKSAEKNLDLRRYYFPPIHGTKIFSKYCGDFSGVLKQTEEIAENMLCLPVYSIMETGLVERVTDIVGNILES